jgi:hypothetical protein
MRRRYLYMSGQWRLPDLSEPQLFTEKVNWRILHDRRPLLAWTCDKAAMKDYASRTCSSDDLAVPRTLWFGDDLAAAPGEPFETSWVLKPNHRSGLVVFGAAGTGVNESIISETASWRHDDQGIKLGEWAYSEARRAFLIEERIGATEELNDYKFFVFDGTVKVVQVDQSRFAGHVRDFYSPDWRRLPVRNRFPSGSLVPRPGGLNKMIRVAERLGASFDFMRVDLYWHAGMVWFGEVTPYPGGGVEPFSPRDFDRQLGGAWTLPELQQ